MKTLFQSVKWHIVNYNGIFHKIIYNSSKISFVERNCKIIINLFDNSGNLISAYNFASIFWTSINKCSRIFFTTIQNEFFYTVKRWCKWWIVWDVPGTFTFGFIGNFIGSLLSLWRTNFSFFRPAHSNAVPPKIFRLRCNFIWFHIFFAVFLIELIHPNTQFMLINSISRKLFRSCKFSVDFSDSFLFCFPVTMNTKRCQFFLRMGRLSCFAFSTTKSSSYKIHVQFDIV